MRQHPIPQNVLDIEFKLFTRFTLKEFAYLALGVGTGGIFLYFTVRGDMPGIVGIPLFAILAGIGSFLALVPINDQPADKAIINYFSAINRPTQRVWLNETLKEQRSKPVLTPDDDTKKVVIGGSKLNQEQKSQIFEENPGDDILATEEEQQVLPEVTKEEYTQTEIATPSQEYLTISDENLNKYQFPIKSVDLLPGNINLWLCTKENQPLSNINTYLKDDQGKILYANKTGPNGYFLTNRIFPEGVYTVEFEGVVSGLPKLKILLSKDFGKLPLKISVI